MAGMDPQVSAVGEIAGQEGIARPSGAPSLLVEGNAGRTEEYPFCDGGVVDQRRGGGLQSVIEWTVPQGGSVRAQGDVNLPGRTGVDERLANLMGGRIQQPNFDSEQTPRGLGNARVTSQPCNVLQPDFNNTRNPGKETRADPGAIPVFRHLVGSHVDKPVFVDKASEWSGYKMAMEVYLASKGAFSAEAQTMHLMGSLSGFARDELMRCYNDREGGWFDLGELWLRLDKFFCRGKTQEFAKDPESWMRKYPWDGNEWSIDNFCSQISQRYTAWLGRAQAGLSRVIARGIFERGLPPELIHELNRKQRDDPTFRTALENVDDLCRAIHSIFREFEDSKIDVPWTQKTDPDFGRPSRQDSGDRKKNQRGNSRFRSPVTIGGWRNGRYYPAASGSKTQSSQKAEEERSRRSDQDSGQSLRNSRADSHQAERFQRDQDNRKRTSFGSPSSIFRQKPRSPSPPASSRFPVSCFYCGKIGHVRADCYKRKNDEQRQRDEQGGGRAPEKMLKAAEWEEKHVDGGGKFYEREFAEENDENPWPEREGALPINSFESEGDYDENPPELSDPDDDESDWESQKFLRQAMFGASGGSVSHNHLESLN